MFSVKKYFCFELLTAGILVGWVGLARSISSCISSIVMMVKFDDIFTDDTFPHTDVDKMHPSESFSIMRRPPFGLLFQLIALYSPVIISLLSTNIAVSIIDVLTSSLLIIGTIKVICENVNVCHRINTKRQFQ